MHIMTHVMWQYEEFLTDPEQDVQYCFGCHVAPYYCTVNSTWLYITKLKPLNVDDDSDED